MPLTFGTIGADEGAEPAHFFTALLDAALVPIVEICERSASLLPPGEQSASPDSQPSAPADTTIANRHGSSRSQSAAAVADTQAAGGDDMPANADRMYLINCLLAVWSPLSLRAACNMHATRLRQRVDVEVRLLVLRRRGCFAPCRPLLVSRVVLTQQTSLECALLQHPLSFC